MGLTFAMVAVNRGTLSATAPTCNIVLRLQPHLLYPFKPMMVLIPPKSVIRVMFNILLMGPCLPLLALQLLLHQPLLLIHPWVQLVNTTMLRSKTLQDVSLGNLSLKKMHVLLNVIMWVHLTHLGINMMPSLWTVVLLVIFSMTCDVS